MVSAISKHDSHAQAQLDRLLAEAGIRRDRNLDYTCGIFDGDYRLIATGSCFKNSLRCLAVSPEHQGEGLLNAVVSHLLTVQMERGNTHVFLCTKPQSAVQIGDLGFYEIARTDETVFMENRRGGFARYLEQLAGQGTDGPSAAVVMNANPFTLGHRYLVEQAAAAFPAVHVFVVQEEMGPIPYAVRKTLVREGLADMPGVILHDGGPYIISAATFPSYFLPDEDAAIRAHAALDLRLFVRIAGALEVECRYVGSESASNVTAIYNQMMAELLPENGVSCQIVPRLQKNSEIVSASTVRQAIHDGRLDDVEYMLPAPTAAYFRSPEAETVIRAIRAMEDPKHY